MLEKLIIVDYVEGAGGEYLAHFINRHINSTVSATDNMQELSGVGMKQLNSFSLIKSDWRENIEYYLEEFINQITVKQLAVPYHLYKFPEHIEPLQAIADQTHFVKIDSVGHPNIAFDFVRKVYFKKLDKSHLSEIKFYTETLNVTSKQQIIQRLKNNNLYWMDLELLKNNQAINKQNRTALIDQALNHTTILPSNDIVISYRDFFVDFKRTQEAYDKLCVQLGIQADTIKLDEFINRNKKNLAELNQFIDNFKQHMEKL